MQEAFTATWWEKSAVKIKDFSWWLAGLVHSINSLFLDILGLFFSTDLFFCWEYLFYGPALCYVNLV